jgi:hypothetical protein
MSQRLTLKEAAAELRAPSARWLREWLRANPRDPQGQLYYTPIGRDKVFHQTDLARIELALREGSQCRSNSGRRGHVKHRTTKSVERTSESEWRQAAELLNDPSLLSSSERSKSASKNTGSIQRPNLRLVQGSPHS